MAKYVDQIRYYGDGNSKNSSSAISRRSLEYGTAFHNTLPIVQLGVQTLPGMKIYINNHINPVVVGQTGIYELNVDGISFIQDLRFDGTTLEIINHNKNNAYLIVDYIYEKEE